MSYAHRPRIAYPGAAGSYTAEASAVLYPDGDLYSAGTFEDVAAHVRDGQAAAGVLPIENSLAGLVAETCDLLADGDAADRRRGRACTSRTACARRRARRSTGSPASSPTPRRCSSAVASSTAASSRRARRRPPTPCARSPTPASATWAAIASPGAAAPLRPRGPRRRHLGPQGELHALRRHRPRADCDRVTASANWRTALRLVTGHEPGALHDAIEPFRYHKVNMVSLHSRPIQGEPWRYQFLVDIDGHRQDEVVVRAIQDVERRSALARHPGHVPGGAALSRRRWRPSPGTRCWPSGCRRTSPGSRTASSCPPGRPGPRRSPTTSIRGCGRRCGGAASSGSGRTRRRPGSSRAPAATSASSRARRAARAWPTACRCCSGCWTIRTPARSTSRRRRPWPRTRRAACSPSASAATCGPRCTTATPRPPRAATPAGARTCC